ncbi:hypothetical protein JCM30237_17420 [Halolamina litorea]|uniref:Uncharacterized protein n=1 Tax=Halolamina litorea TaxID=1515593 RepID=A0ABD6BRE4_9EURY|nr:hypothetical protein [Halolamina litorea]
MEPGLLALLGLIGALVGYRLLDRRLDERPSGLLTLVVAVGGGALLAVVGPEPLDAEVLVPLAMLALFGAAQVVGSYVSVSTRAFGALALVVAAGMAALGLTPFVGAGGRSLAGAVMVGMLGALCLFRPEAVERVTETAE